MRKLSAATKFIEPMYAVAVQRLPQGADWLYEINSTDIGVSPPATLKDIRLWSRRGNSLTTQVLCYRRRL